MRLLYINPNSTAAMTADMVAVARAAAPGIEVIGWTNAEGPPAIQGEADGAAAVPGVLALLPAARAAGAEAIVIGCFDDTGLAEIRAAAHCPVIGIGQAAYHAAALLGLPFSVVTTLAVSIPVIAGNIAAYGLAGQCRRVRASGIPVLELEGGTQAVMARLSDEIAVAAQEDGAGAVILGCAGMGPLVERLQPAAPVKLIDGVAAAALLAPALAQLAR